jgi:phenylpropionate dioxygenase-like ring-hydroxylating dioxygenase large terminal subunit
MNAPVRELVENVSAPFERARAMPRSVYTSEDFLKAELRDVFARDWVCVGRASALKAPGDYLAYELAGEPIVVLRDGQGALRAMSNVCRHRMSTLLEGRGSARAIVCPYHGWTYNLDGSLRAAPAMTKNAGFCKDDYKLPQVRCEEWLGWIMLTLNRDAPPVAEQLSEVRALIDDFGMEGYVESFRETFRWNTNWKVLAENFMESYHLPVCHSGTIGGLSKLDEMVCPPGNAMFNYHWILKDDTLKIALAHPSNTRLKGDRRRTTFLLSIYPSLLITITPGYFWYLSLHPHGPGQVDVLYGGGMSPDFAYAPEAQQHFAAVKKLLDRVNEEDKGCVEKVYRGLCSGLAEPGALSHLERPNYDFAQYLAERTGGFERRFG